MLINDACSNEVLKECAEQHGFLANRRFFGGKLSEWGSILEAMLCTVFDQGGWNDARNVCRKLYAKKFSPSSLSDYLVPAVGPDDTSTFSKFFDLYGNDSERQKESRYSEKTFCSCSKFKVISTR